MITVYDEMEVTRYDRWEDPGDYPNALAAFALPPGSYYPDEAEGHALFEMNDDDWTELQEYIEEGEPLAHFFDLKGVKYKVNPYEEDYMSISEIDYKPILNNKYLVVTPVEFGDFECGPGLDYEVEDAIKTLNKLGKTNQ